MNTVQQTNASFVDAHGASVMIPADALSLYSQVKTEQLAALTGMIADLRSGFNFEPSEIQITAFETLASELAYTVQMVVCALTQNIDNDARVKKGGAA